MSPGARYSIVVPTVGRPSLAVLLNSLVESAQTASVELPTIYLVDDRRDAAAGLNLADIADVPVKLLRTGGRGPAAARNAGWRECDTEWVVFLDDDVVVSRTWMSDVADDLSDAPDVMGGVQGRIDVPLPVDRRPNDWERGTAGLSSARWITADMAYRLSVLRRLGGFDEQFPRAFREDADLALRVLDLGYLLSQGERRTTHPVRPAGWWASAAQQRGNADDVLMRRLHGRGWRRRADASLGRRPQHLFATSALLGTVLASLGRRRRLAAIAGVAWAASSAEFAWLRIKPGPRDLAEVARMASTSLVIPPLASWHWVAGIHRHRRVRRGPRRPAAVLLDRDGTIVIDVPYNGDPERVSPMPDARLALDRLRNAGIPIAVVSNQSGIARGLITAEQVDAVNARIEELLGPFDGWFVCPHSEDAGCWCRKPAPGLVNQAAARLGVDVRNCVVIGDIGSDTGAAAAAGARGILVPTAATLPAEVAAATVPAEVAAATVYAGTLNEAVDLLLAVTRT